MRSHLLFGVVATLASAALAACNVNPLPPPSVANTVDTVTLYALHGTLITTPSGYSLTGPEAVITSLSPGFDFTFDIDSTGQAELLPLGALVPPSQDSLNNPGLESSNSLFGNITLAPTGGYELTQPLHVATGSVVLIQSAAQVCADGLTESLYAKLEVLAISDSARTIQFQILVDENCGYLGLAPGFPTQ
jgi:hypothetical protein